MSDKVNGIEWAILEWIEGDQELLKNMQGIARNDECGHGPECEGPKGCDYEYGDDELAEYVMKYIDGDDWGAFLGGVAAAQRLPALRALMPSAWADQVSWEKIREALLSDAEPS